MGNSVVTSPVKGMSTGRIIGIGFGVLAAVAIAANIKDLIRYIRIASM